MNKNWFVLLTVIFLVSFGVCVECADAAEVITREPDRDVRTFAAKVASPVLYDHGDLGYYEQDMLEMINRARANPADEIYLLLDADDQYIDAAVDSFGLSRNVLIAEFASYGPQPPLAPSATLAESALRHSQDMAANDFQSHTGSDGSTLAERVSDAGYDYCRAGENIYAYAYSMIHAQAAFLIDWGVEDLGHRNNLLNLGTYTDFYEVGIAVVQENLGVTAVGPYIVTQDFGAQCDGNVFVTGVAYRDEDGDGEYDMREALGGVEIVIDGVDYYAITATPGGYAIPVPANLGNVVVNVSRDDLPEKTELLTIGDVNVKLDFVYGDQTLGRISGSVVDQSNNAVAGVSVTLEPVGLTAVSDGSGDFEFTDLDAGTYTLGASLTGYIVTPNALVILLDAREEFSTRLTVSSSEPPDTDIDTHDDTPDDIVTAGPCGTVLILLICGMWFAGAALSHRSSR